MSQVSFHVVGMKMMGNFMYIKKHSYNKALQLIRKSGASLAFANQLSLIDI